MPDAVNIRDRSSHFMSALHSVAMSAGGAEEGAAAGTDTDVDNSLACINLLIDFGAELDEYVEESCVSIILHPVYTPYTPLLPYLPYMHLYAPALHVYTPYIHL